FEIALVENVQREDLNAMEEARAYQALIQRFDYTQDRAATAVGKSRSHVANTLRLLQLPERVQDHLLHGRLTAGHARAILAAADPRLIVPLDVPTTADARRLAAALGDAVSFYKVGLELFASDGMVLARELKAQGKQVFIDWKLHDIGATVERAAAVLAGSGCD